MSLYDLESWEDRPAPAAALEQRVTDLETMVARLLHILVRRGDISINDAREVHGLPALEPPEVCPKCGTAGCLEDARPGW